MILVKCIIRPTNKIAFYGDSLIGSINAPNLCNNLNIYLKKFTTELFMKIFDIQIFESLMIMVSPCLLTELWVFVAPTKQNTLESTLVF